MVTCITTSTSTFVEETVKQYIWNVLHFLTSRNICIKHLHKKRLKSLITKLVNESVNCQNENIVQLIKLLPSNRAVHVGSFWSRVLIKSTYISIDRTLGWMRLEVSLGFKGINKTHDMNIWCMYTCIWYIYVGHWNWKFF